MGSSYCFPVRLSVIVRVSAIVVIVLRLGRLCAWDPVAAIGPAGEILQLTPFAAEGSPLGIDQMGAAEYAKPCIHDLNSMGSMLFSFCLPVFLSTSVHLPIRTVPGTVIARYRYMARHAPRRLTTIRTHRDRASDLPRRR